MSRNTAGIRILAFCLATIACSYARSQDLSKDVQAVQGLWIGSYGGGERDGVTFQPLIAEVLVKGNHIELLGYPSTVAGIFRLDSNAKQITITASDESGRKSTAKTVSFGYQVKDGELTITDKGKPAITFQRRNVVQHPLANAQVELVAAEGINKAGDLLVTEFSRVEAGLSHAIYFEPHKQSFKTRNATLLVVEKTGCKKIGLDEARSLIRQTTPVVIAYHQGDRQPAPDGEAVGRTFSGVLQPGTLIFVLSAKENVPLP